MSTLKVTTIRDLSNGTAVDVPNAAKAWVNFNGTGTVAIRASYNVTSITDHGTGDYTVNFTTALTDANYASLASTSAVVGTAIMIPNINGSTVGGGQAETPSASSFRFTNSGYSGAVYDATYIHIAVFR